MVVVGLKVVLETMAVTRTKRKKEKGDVVGHETVSVNALVAANVVEAVLVIGLDGLDVTD